MKNNLKKVALIGGAYDPPTLGHIALAKFVLEKGGFQQCWLVPCNNHMYEKEMASAEHRVNMCALMCEPKMHVFDYEIVNDLKGDTYGFMERLLREGKYREHNFSIVIGMDNANTFTNWVKYMDLIQMVPFVVVSRGGVVMDNSSAWYMKFPHTYLEAGLKIPAVSSSEIRNAVAKGKRLKGLVTEEVEAYIDGYGLYKKEKA